MNEPTKKQRQLIFRKQEKIIKRILNDNTSIAEAKLLLLVLIFHFDGFAPKQQLVNRYMSFKYHWGNKRTARVLQTLADVGVIDRSTGPDNWTLFFLVKGFLVRCGEPIERAVIAIKERLSRFRIAILSITRTRETASGT